jgi:hypothetical protein
MPTMSDRYHAFIAPIIESVDDLQEQLLTLHSEIKTLQESWAEAGLVRGLHYTVTPIRTAEINDMQDTLPSRIPLCRIGFRNGRSFDIAKRAIPGAAEPVDRL